MSAGAPRNSEKAFLGVSALLFIVSSLITLVWCASMASMGGMQMAGGWTMSMAWMRMPGQSWPGVAISFLGMWTVMMVAMMLPALVPMLRRYRAALGAAAGPRLGGFTVLAGVAYFLVWVLSGAIAFAVGVVLAALAMSFPEVARVAPFAAALTVIAGGLLQFSAWKSRRLACCRQLAGRGVRLAADARTAWNHGLRLGIHCSSCCVGLTAILLAVGVMDLTTMAIVTGAICLERLAPARSRAAHGVGAVAVAAGLFLLARASGG